MSALFINFKGIDYDADEEAGVKLDAYIRWVQRVAERYEAIFDHLTMGDKGSYICLAFGAPIAHSDDENPCGLCRAGAALTAAGAGVYRRYPDRRRCGPGAGGHLWRQGTPHVRCPGRPGQPGPRLMIAAPEGDILCDEEIYRAAQGQVTFTALPPIRVKGFAEPVAVFRPTGNPAGAAQFAVASSTAVRNRLDHLSPSEQLVLKVASVLGPAFTAATLGEIFPVDSERVHLDDHLCRLEEQGLLVRSAGEGVYTFASGVIHHAAYGSMLFVQRRHLHRQVAEWYERTYRADPAAHYAILAHHWRHGDESAKAIEYLEKAGRQAQAKGAFEEAEQLFRESLELDAGSAVLSSAYYGDGAAHAGPDTEGALRYALSRLERELSPELTYHNLWHTAEDVLPAAQRLAALMGVSPEDARLLEIGAAYHDIGFVVRRQEHERAGAEIAAQVLPGFGFTSEQVAAVQGMILATRLPQSPRTPLEEILADADLDVLGREDSLARSQALRAELASFGAPVAETEWYRRQLKFFREHRYFTSAARSLPVKRENEGTSKRRKPRIKVPMSGISIRHIRM